MVDFDLLIETPLDTNSFFIVFIARCMYSLPRALFWDAASRITRTMNYFKRNLKSVRKGVKRFGTSRTEWSVQGCWEAGLSSC